MPGLTDSGFETKSFQQIREDLEATFKSLGGDQFNIRSTSPSGQMIGIFTKQLYDTWQAALNNYQSRFPATSQGKALDHSVALAGLERKGGFKTSGVVYLSGAKGTVVPVRTLVSTLQDVSFETQDEVVLDTGSKPVIRIKRQAGNSADAYRITVQGGFGGLFSGVEGRTELISFAADEATVKAAFDNLLNETGAVETVDTSSSGVSVTFAKERFLPLFLLENGVFSTVRGGVPDGAAVGVNAVEDGPIVISPFQVKQINNPISGLNRVINLTSFVVGREPETDAELRGRWLQRVQGPQISSAVSVRNEVANLSGVSQVLLFEGRGEFEVVVSGGEDEDIAKAIYNSKSLGSFTSGSTSQTIEDVNGNPKIVYFSRPELRSFYVRVTVGRLDDFPADGESLIRSALSDYVNSFRIGGVVRPSPDMIWALRGIPGINTLAIRISDSGLDGSYSLKPVQLLNREKAAFARVEVIFS